MIYNVCPIPIYITKIDAYPKKEMISVLDNLIQKEDTTNEDFSDDQDVEQVHNISIFQPLNDWIGHHTKEYLKYFSNATYSLYSQKSWGVRVNKGGGVHPHKHENGHVSCVFYVSLPKGCNDVLTFKHNSLEIDALPINSDDRRLIATDVKVEEGQLIIFPSMLGHGTMTTSESEESRFSVSYDMCFGSIKPQEHTMLDISKWKKL